MPSLLTLAFLVPIAQDSSKPVPLVPELPARIATEITPTSSKSHVEALAGFGTRHSLSDVESETRGIGAARRFIEKTLRGYSEATGGRLEVSFERFEVPAGRRIPEAVQMANVVAVLPGKMDAARSRHYYVLGHYDSRARKISDPNIGAPGANDDASGVAVVMELARVLADEELDSTVVFLATTGEEQGLLGAAHHAESAKERGIDIRAALSNDIVGDPSGPPDAEGHKRMAADRIRVFSEGIPSNAEERELRSIRSLSAENDSPSRQLARFIDDVAERHSLKVRPMLIYRPDRFLRGGDHTPFNRLGFPAVRFSEVYENYQHQHEDVRVENGVKYGDLAEFVDAEYLAGVARLNATALIHLANAPSSPGDVRMLVNALANDTTLRWSESPEPDVAGYEVVWRETTSPRWDHVRNVGKVTEAVIDLSKDNWFFGVRAYDGDGFRSPVHTPVSARQ